MVTQHAAGREDAAGAQGGSDRSKPITEQKAGENEQEHTDAPPADGANVPSREELLEAIHNRRRRYTLHYLQEYGGVGPVDLADVSRQVAAWERGTDPDTIRYDDRKNVHTSLYQFHAPKLADLGLIEYDRRQSTIELTEYGENLRLDLDATEDREWIPQLFMGLSGLSVAIVAVSALDYPLFRAVPDVAWTALVAALFVGSSALLVSSQRTAQRVVTQHPPEPVEDKAD